MVKFEIPASVQAELAARDAAKEKEAEKALKTGVFKLQYPWSNDKRGMPKVLLRSALFGVVRRGRREYLQGAQIAAWGESYIRYTGGKLMQSDQDLWMACVEACKRAGQAQVVISQSELLRLAGKSNCKAWLINTLERLVATAITVKDGQYTYVGSLIHDAVKDDETGHIALNFHHKV